MQTGKENATDGGRERHRREKRTPQTGEENDRDGGRERYRWGKIYRRGNEWLTQLTDKGPLRQRRLIDLYKPLASTNGKTD